MKIRRRLTRRSLGYYFDRAGNRQQVTDTANPTINYVVTNLNQYQSVSGGSISNGLEHEVSSFQGLYDTHPINYYYVNDEHLKQVSDTAYGDTYNLYYDALGRCVKRDLNGVSTYYVYDGEKPVVEYNSTGIVGRNVYGKAIDEILMRTDPTVNSGQSMYYAQDHEGSVTHLLNGCTTANCGTGNVLEKYAYDAFGVPTFMDSGGNNLNPNATAYNNRFLFTGREYAATYRSNYVSTFSFYEYRARAYNPNLGRFMSEDPKLFDAGDYNLFRYCHNDPIDLTDPMGLDDTAPTYSPRQTSLQRAESGADAVWAMAKWADSSNNFQGTFAQFASSQALSMGQVAAHDRPAGGHDPISVRPQVNKLGIQGAERTRQESKSEGGYWEKAVTIQRDPESGKWSLTQKTSTGHPTLHGGQEVIPPRPDRGTYEIWGSSHYHTDNLKAPSAADFYYGNKVKVPVYIGYPDGRILRYRPYQDAPAAESRQGVLELIF